MVKLERISHFAAAIATDPTDTHVCCIGLLFAALPCGVVPSKYSPVSHDLQTMEVYQRCANPAILNVHFVRVCRFASAIMPPC